MSQHEHTDAGWASAVQQEFYAGAGDPLPVSPGEWKRRARAVLADGPFGYVAGAAGANDTMRANRDAFRRVRLAPRMLRDVARRSLRTELFGASLAAPVAFAPVAALGILHADAERAPARVAASLGLPLVASSVSSCTMEAIAAEMGDATRWFQLYPSRDRAIVASFVQRAERAGYSAIVITLDAMMLGWRETDLRNRYSPFLSGHGLANYHADPAFLRRLARSPEEDPATALRALIDVYLDPRFSWDDVAYVQSLTSLPVLLKGLLRADDARDAVARGVSGLVVSNHGGRQVDGAIASLDALRAIVDAVGDRVPVLLDSGVRRGADVLKAIALGARAVLYGRPYPYALAVAGEAGVRHATRCLLGELDLQMALCGCASLRDVDRSLLSPDCECLTPASPHSSSSRPARGLTRP